jgi:3-methylcrotonyl-CoA carboxylase alpha subunit
MARRVTLRSGREDKNDRWTVTVEAERVVVAGLDGDFVITGAADSPGRTEDLTVTHGDHAMRGAAVRDGDRVWVSIDGHVFDFTIETGDRPRRASRDDHDALTPPMPATVLKVAVTVGAAVADGDVLVVLEAMKMELSIRAPRAGRIKAIRCREGELVQPGTILIELEDL